MSDFTASNGIILSPRPDGRLKIIYRNSSARDYGETWAGADDVVALREYFRHEANPKRKPWEDAKPGEVWEINGFPAWRLESGAFMFDDESFLFTEDITSGRRIWPEDGA